MPTIETFKRLFRFALVGGAATLLYGLLSVILLQGANLSAMGAHLLAYVLVIPLSFFGQKKITFGFKGDHGKTFLRFVAMSVFALSLSTFSVWTVWALGYAPFYGTIATMLIVPVTSYLMMAFWVFVDRTQTGSVAKL